MRLVQDFLEHSAARRPDAIALVCGSVRITYAELDRMANRIAHGLRNRGVRRGDRVVVMLRNSVETVAAIFGILKADAVFVVLNHQTKRDKAAGLLNHCGAAAIIVEASLMRQGLAEVLGGDVPSLKLVAVTGLKTTPGSSSQIPSISFEELQEGCPAAPPPRTNIDVDLAGLVYTSGSTGNAKGVMCDHSNVLFVTESIAEYLQHDESDVVLSALPLSFSYGIYQLFVTFFTGGRLVLEESFAFPAAVLQRIGPERVTGFAGVPTMYALMLSLDLSAFDFSSLRYLTNAAAALPGEHLDRLRKHFGTVSIFCMHGLTEVARTTYLPPGELNHRLGSVGHAIPGTEIWLEDENGRITAPGEVGEMVIRGRHVMRGYWNDPAATAERFPPGPLPGERICRSGDLFRTDADGYLYFVSRKDDIIKSRGEKVPPKEVENVLYSLEGVLEAAVIGVFDPILGEAIKAFVVAPGKAYSAAHVFAHCKARLEDFMVPRYVEFVESLPKTASGKIRKVELRQWQGSPAL
jgi:long-chain acyl-CoA synthetase